jgi:hypothetical protein
MWARSKGKLLGDAYRAGAIRPSGIIRAVVTRLSSAIGVTQVIGVLYYVIYIS